MNIKNHLLFDDHEKQVDFQPTPNKGGKLAPQYLVIHYTAATTARGSISWFLNNAAKASAHLLIDRDGSVIQFAPFNLITWHAGQSEWNGLKGMNNYSIGIELVNGGRLSKSGESWLCSVDKKQVADADVVIATHKNEDVEAAWHAYTEKQLQVAAEIATLLLSTYKLKNVLGHEDIAPHRKCDPGPAFPMANFRSKVLGRKDDVGQLHKTTVKVNIRAGAGTQFKPVSKMLPPETPVRVLKRDGNWSFVEVMKAVHGLNDVEGWIMSKFLLEG